MLLFSTVDSVRALLTDIATTLGAVTAIGIALAAIARFKPVRWLWKKVDRHRHREDHSPARFMGSFRRVRRPLAGSTAARFVG